MHRSFRLLGGQILSLAALAVLGACGGVQLGSDALSRNLPPDQAQLCREAVADAMLREGISTNALKNVDYQAVDGGNSRSTTRIRGYQAWVYPQSGGAWLVELTTTCQVRDVRLLRES